MSASQEELKVMFKEAERRGDRTTALKIMDMLESSAKPPQTKPVKTPPTDPKKQDKMRQALLNIGELAQEGDSTAWSVIKALAETGLTVGTGILAEPIAGLSGGVAALFEGADTGSEVMKTVREGLTYSPRSGSGQKAIENVAGSLAPVAEGMKAAEQYAGDIGYEVGGPTGGAFAATLPTAALETVGFALPKVVSKMGKTAKKAPEDIPEKPPVEPQEFEIPKVNIEDVSYKDIADGLKKKKTAKVAEELMPDKEIMDAAERLGVVVNPSAYSKNRAYIDMEQALKSRPGSKIATIEEKSIMDLGSKADDLINDLSGSTDKSLFDLNVREDFTRTITDLENQANTAYDAIKKTIPAEVRVGVRNTRKYLKDKLKELGGDASLLNPVEKKLRSITQDNKVPTYAALDRVRKDVGSGFNKNSGPFKDVDEGALKQIYRVLSEDQQGVANAFNLGTEYTAARKLVSSRKELEKAAQAILGRDLNKSIVPKLAQAGTALTKGDVSHFRKLMETLPPNRRTEAAATMLNDLFTLGARQKGAIGQGFVNAYKGLNRNKVAKKILFDQFPPGTVKRFNDIGDVATGIFKSKALENTSKTARDIIHAMEDGGLFAKVLSAGEKITPIPGTGTSAVGIGSAILKGKPFSEAADNLITSPVFKKALEQAARGAPARAERMLKQNSKFKKWLTTVSPENKQQIMAIGFIPWVTGEEDVE